MDNTVFTVQRSNNTDLNTTNNPLGQTTTNILQLEVKTTEACNTRIYYRKMVSKQVATSTITSQADKLTWIEYMKNRNIKPKTTYIISDKFKTQ